MGRVIVFYARQNNKASEPDSFVVRVRGYGASAAQTAGQGISSAAQTAGAGVSKGVRQGVYAVRVWAAPWLESIADYCTGTAAPKVSSALRSTAQQVRPEDVTQKKSRSLLTWSVLGAAVLATAGAAAALVKYRYRSSVRVETDEEFGSVSPAGAQGGTSGAQPATPTTAASQGSGDSAPEGADAGVNGQGQVSTSGW
jgi:hypothetical protein